jgi:hypothetical protein
MNKNLTNKPRSLRSLPFINSPEGRPVGVCCVIIFSFLILDQVDILILLINLPF